MTTLLRRVGSTVRRDAERFKVRAEADEAELRRARARLHLHFGILIVGVVVINVCAVAGMGDQVVLYVTWLLSGCQEYVDYFGRL